MSILHVRGLEEQLYGKLNKLAEQHGRSLSAEVIALLQQAVEREELRTQRNTVLLQIKEASAPYGETGTTSTNLLREDRER